MATIKKYPNTNDYEIIFQLTGKSGKKYNVQKVMMQTGKRRWVMTEKRDNYVIGDFRTMKEVKRLLATIY